MEFLITIIDPARAGFLEPGRITLGAHFGGVDGDRRSARCSLLKTTPIVSTVKSMSCLRYVLSVTEYSTCNKQDGEECQGLANMGSSNDRCICVNIHCSWV